MRSHPLSDHLNAGVGALIGDATNAYMSASTAPLTLRCLGHGAEVEAAWASLEADGRCTAFQTRAWLRPFYRHVAPALGLQPLFLLGSGDDGAPRLLWPLVRERRLGLPVLACADAGISDYNAPLHAEAALPPTVWAQVLQTLRGHGALLRLDKLPPATVGTASLAALLPAPIEASFGTWAVELPPTLAEFERRALSPAFVKDLAMRRRRLERKGCVRFALAATPAERRTAFDALARQRARRFAETGRDDILAHPAFRRCYEAAAVDEPGDTVRLFTLSVDDRVVAAMLALDHAGTRHMVMPSFEGGEWKNCSPGNLLMLQAIGHAIEHGLTRFDFTIGDEPYKAGFGARRLPMHGALLPLSAAGHVAARGVALARGMRRRMARPVLAATAAVR